MKYQQKYSSHNCTEPNNLLRSRSISEPEINFDKSALNPSRFKSKNFPFEYIAVDDLHYYRRRKPYLHASNISLNEKSKNVYSNSSSIKSTSPPFQTEYKKHFYEKPCHGKLNPLKRPPNLKVNTYPFLVGNLCKSEPNLTNYKTQYEINFPPRPYSPRIGPLRRATNIKLNPGVMDIFSEQKSQFKPYSEEIVSKARPPMVKKPNNLFLTGEIELFPEYRTSYVPYNLESVFEFNKPSCGHYKIKKSNNKEKDNTKMRRERAASEMPDRDRALEAKILNNNYGVSCSNRYHQKMIDAENGNFIPEYKSQYQAAVGEKSSMIPQRNNLNVTEHGSHFEGSSEYKNRYKTYEQFIKSAPIKKQDNLVLQKTKNQTQPEYTERFKQVDMNSYERRMPYRRQDNLQTEGDFPREMPEYHEKYREPHHSSFPERARAREDFLALDGEMEYSPEYRKNYVEFPRQRPIIRRPPSNVQMPVTMERERKKDKNVDLPIEVAYHGKGSASRLTRMASDDSDEIPLHARPEYRKAMRYNMIKERSPSRANGNEKIAIKSPDENNNNQMKETPNNNNNVANNVTNNDGNDTTKILSENKANMKDEQQQQQRQQLNMFNERNEVIVEPLKPPENFKLPRRSPENQATKRAPSYPIQRDKLFNDEISNYAQKRMEPKARPMKVTIDSYDPNECTYSDDEPAPPRKEFVDTYYHPPPPPEEHKLPPPQSIMKKKSPKFGRRATNPVENYNLRMKTNVIEANPRYIRHERRREIIPNCHERSAFYHQANQSHHMMPQARPPADSLANNYYQNYEINKQQNYRESLRDERNPFVVIDNNRQMNSKPNSWMRKSWYDTQ